MAGSSTQIGSAAIVLSANADKLTSGLSKAANDVNKWAGGVSKSTAAAANAAGGDGKGGFLGKLLGFGAIGGAAGLAFAGLQKATQFIRELPDLTARLGEKASGSDQGALQSIGQGLTRVQEGAENLLTKGLALLAPAFGALVDAGSAFGQRVAPWVEKVGAALEAELYTVAELVGEFLSGAADVVDSIAKWAQETLGLADTTSSASDRMFAVLRLVGKGYAYVWDTVKAGAGVVAVVVGYIEQGFGTLVKTIGKAIEQLSRLAEQLPESIRPDWIGKAADAVKGWGDGIDVAGQKMVAWGKSAVFAWGDSSVAVDKWFDKVRQRFNERKAQFENPIPLTPKLAGAFTSGSREAASIVAKFQAGALASGRDVGKDQLKAQEQANDWLRQIAENTRGPGLKLDTF